MPGCPAPRTLHVRRAERVAAIDVQVAQGRRARQQALQRGPLEVAAAKEVEVLQAGAVPLVKLDVRQPSLHTRTAGERGHTRGGMQQQVGTSL